MLFDPRAHEPRLDAPWSPAEAEAAIRAIARDADAALRDRAWWPVHPLDADDGTSDGDPSIYCGAAGVLWALHRLAEAGLHEPRHDYPRLAGGLLELDAPEPGLWLGEAGVGLVAWLLSPSPELADQLARLAVVDPGTDTLELLLGSPGLLLLADVMLEQTGEDRWAAAWRALADHLMAQWGAHVRDLWTQDLYGETKEILGPAHGMAGVVAALARRPALLPPSRLAPRATSALAATAIREGEHANWPARAFGPLADERGHIRTQWCHGAPGMVASLCALPRDDELDALLLAGGELTWAAGPLRKGASLCHGTAGNGFALLKLFTRTGDEAWLERARRFAMHAVAQVGAARQHHGHGRYSLWSGDLGTAVYLQQCLAAGSDLPALDRW